jgi:hypothetical protein
MKARFTSAVQGSPLQQNVGRPAARERAWGVSGLGGARILNESYIVGLPRERRILFVGALGGAQPAKHGVGAAKKPSMLRLIDGYRTDGFARRFMCILDVVQIGRSGENVMGWSLSEDRDIC